MKRVVLAVALIAVFTEPLYAQRNADVLRGLPGYGLFAESALSATWQVDDSIIMNWIVEHIGHTGLPRITSKEQWEQLGLTPETIPFLNLSIDVRWCVQPDAELLAGRSEANDIVVTLELRQAVRLARDSRVTTHAITWRTSAWEFGTRHGSLKLQQLVYRVADDFVIDYLSANRS